jgi:hypothetical protein
MLRASAERQQRGQQAREQVLPHADIGLARRHNGESQSRLAVSDCYFQQQNEYCQ